MQRIYYRCSDAIDQGDEVSRSDMLREIQDICTHALRGAHEDRRLALRPEQDQPAPVAATVSPAQVKRRRPRRGGKMGMLLGDRPAFSSTDISSPSAPYTYIPCPSLAQPHHSPSYSHEAFTPDIEPYVTLTPEVAHEDSSAAAIPMESKVEPDISLSEHIDIVTVATTHHVLNSPQPNISELDNMVGAIAMSPSSASEMFVPPNSMCPREDDVIMSISERSKLKKRKAKS